jgi:hypothetical protein
MSKRKSKKSDKYTEITTSIGYLPETGSEGDISIDVSVRRCIEVTFDGPGHIPTELNTWEARKLGRALLKAAAMS